VCAALVTAGEPWKLSLDANLTMTLNTYSNNWAGSEKGSLSWATNWLGIAEKQMGKSFNTKNTLKLAFGQTKVQDEETDHWSAPQKSTDQIEFESVLKMTLNTWVDPFIGVRVTSQFLDGRDPGLAHYGNPVEVMESFGGRRDLVKKDALTWDLRLAGAARQHVDRIWDDLNTSDGGIEMVTELNAVVRKDVVKFTSTLKLYEALMRAGSDTLPDWWRHPDNQLGKQADHQRHPLYHDLLLRATALRPRDRREPHLPPGPRAGPELQRQAAEGRGEERGRVAGGPTARGRIAGRGELYSLRLARAGTGTGRQVFA